VTPFIRIMCTNHEPTISAPAEVPSRAAPASSRASACSRLRIPPEALILIPSLSNSRNWLTIFTVALLLMPVEVLTKLTPAWLQILRKTNGYF